MPPSWLVRRRVGARLRYLAQDDALLVQAGGVAALEDDEVALACVDRGIDMLNKKAHVSELRDKLARWLGLTTAHDLGERETLKRMEWLLVVGDEQWPSHWPAEFVDL